jgi:hypothetical protein
MWGALSEERSGVSFARQSAVFIRLSVCTQVFIFYMINVWSRVYTIYTRPLSVQAQYSNLCPTNSNSRWHDSLDAWTVLRVTAAEFKPFVFKKLSFTLSWCGRRSVLVSGTPLGPTTRFFLFTFFCRTIALPFVLWRPLWREDGSVICSAMCQWSESQRAHNHTLLSHLRLLGSLSVASYDSQGLRWKHPYPPPHWSCKVFLTLY